MAFRVTMLQNDEKFCTLQNGELVFWMIEDDRPVEVDPLHAWGADNWTLETEEKK